MDLMSIKELKNVNGSYVYIFIDKLKNSKARLVLHGCYKEYIYFLKPYILIEKFKYNATKFIIKKKTLSFHK